MKMVRVKDVKPVRGFVVRVWFTDGTDREIDLGRYIASGDVFKEIRSNPNVFRTIIVTEGRTIGWGDYADICPDVLYHDLPLATATIREKELALV